MAVPSPRSLLSSFRELDRRIWILAAARAVNTVGFSMVMPFMAVYIVKGLGGTGKTYGSIYLVAGVGAAVSQALAGELADRIGRRRLMVTALVLRAANLAAMGAAVLLGAGLAPLAILIVTNGVLRAQFEPAAQAAVAEMCPGDRRVAAFGLQRMGVNAGWALGPALGGVFAEVSYGVMFFFAAGMTIVATVFVLRMRDVARVRPVAEPAAPRATLRELLLEHRAFVIYLSLVFAGATMTVQLFSTLTMFSTTELHLSEADVGLLYTVNGALVLLLQIPAVALIDRAGPRRALVFGPLLYTIAYVAIGVSGSYVQLALAVALLTAGEVVFAPALSDMAVHLGDPRRLGRAFGLFGLMQQLGVSVGPLVGGLAYDHLRHDHLLMWGSIAGGMATVGIGYALFAALWRRRTS